MEMLGRRLHIIYTFVQVDLYVRPVAHILISHQFEGHPSLNQQKYARERNGSPSRARIAEQVAEVVQSYIKVSSSMCRIEHRLTLCESSAMEQLILTVTLT